MRCNVILRETSGGLGNRMFMYASAYGLARTKNCRLHVHIFVLHEFAKSFEMKKIDENMWLSSEAYSKLTNVVERNSICTYQSDLLRTNAFKNIELIGYWQSYLHFDAFREEIREIFSARLETLKHIGAYFRDITMDICPSCLPIFAKTQKELCHTFRTRYNITWISIHIRLYDFKRIGYASDDAYIYRAMAYFQSRFHNQDVRFLMASDDKPYCHHAFREKIARKKVFLLPDYFSAADDLIALSFCHHSIVTGGTFGFWTAYFAGGDVIHDIKYKAVCAPTDYYPPWFVLVGSPIQKFLTNKS
ncbi:hypothetical protein I4U23_007829 [Adineta vaga]|nr:hypothetical protein I4U23_007829 [Adineta vaga]